MSDERFTKIVFPLINMNGNKKEDLINELEQFVTSLDETFGKLCDITIHGRNYYLHKDEDAFFNARSQNERWRESITKIRKEAMNLYENIYDQ